MIQKWLDLLPKTPLGITLFALAALLCLAVVALTVFALAMTIFGPRIISRLTLKYLWKRRIAWVSLIAVMLCTTMVLVVISVMGGWLRMFREQFHGLSGDIVISRPSLSGYPHYQEMIDEIEKIPEVKAAVPSLRTYGLINILNVQRDGVQVIGYPIERIGQVNNFATSLYRQYEDLKPDQQQLVRDGKRVPTFDKFLPPEAYQFEMPNAKSDVTKWPGMIVGVGVVGIERDEEGKRKPMPGLYTAWAKLTVLGVSDSSVSFSLENKAERPYWIVDDSRTQIWQFDQNTVYVPFDVLQKDLGMDAQQVEDTRTHQKVTLPARTNDLQVGLKPGFDMYAVKPKIAAVVDRIADKYQQLARDAAEKHDPSAAMLAESARALGSLRVQTWEEMQAKFLGAVEKEKVLVTGLFGIISVVAVFLVFCIFYMIVVEKTRDIGIIKSVGATNRGVAGIFLGYGLAIGVVGAGCGLLLGYFIVHNINYLHAQLGKWMGIQMWDPSTYQFDSIPNQMNPVEATVIVIIAIAASLIGALVPAWRAARMHPVESLRWE